MICLIIFCFLSRFTQLSHFYDGQILTYDVSPSCSLGRDIVAQGKFLNEDPRIQTLKLPCPSHARVLMHDVQYSTYSSNILRKYY